MWQARNAFAILFLKAEGCVRHCFVILLVRNAFCLIIVEVDNLTINESLNYSTDMKQAILIGKALNVICLSFFPQELMNACLVWLWWGVRQAIQLKEAKRMTSVRLNGKLALWCLGMNEDVKLHQIDSLHRHHVMIRCSGLVSLLMSVIKRGFWRGHHWQQSSDTC